MTQIDLIKTERKKPAMAYTVSHYKVVTLREMPAPDTLTLCDNPDPIAIYYRDVICTDPHHNADVESFYVIHLNTRRRALGHHLVSQGTLDTILVSPREVFRAAIVANASAIVLLHNHPSGDPTPSDADIRATRDLVKAGQTVKIEVLDHVIMGTKTEREKGHRSLRELGYFYA